MKKYIVIVIGLFCFAQIAKAKEIPKRSVYVITGKKGKSGDGWNVRVGAYTRVGTGDNQVLQRHIFCAGGGKQDCTRSIAHTKSETGDTYPRDIINYFNAQNTIAFAQIEERQATGNIVMRVASAENPSEIYTMSFVWATNAAQIVTYITEISRND